VEEPRCKEPLSRAQVREIDRRAIEDFGIPGAVLMENAGRGAAAHACRMLRGLSEAAGRPPRVAILCGPGNNGGDGYVIARHLHNAGISVELFSSVDTAELRGDAVWAHSVVRRMALEVALLAQTSDVDQAAARWMRCDLIVDALLGTGARGAPRGIVAEIISAVNTLPRARVLAVDLPSGLDCDTGQPAGPCVRAHATVTFVAPKLGFAAEAAQAVLGRVVVVDIGAPVR
jgi:NAD(P)H-hydrate epimerase